MRAMFFQALLLGIAASALPAGALVLHPAGAEVLLPTRTAIPTVGDSLKTQLVSMDSVARAAGARAPFRLSRRPPGVAYDPDRVAVPGTSPAPVAPRPLLTVSGIAWGGGVKPTAVLEGLPGAQGPRAVRA